VKTHITEMI